MRPTSLSRVILWDMLLLLALLAAFLGCAKEAPPPPVPPAPEDLSTWSVPELVQPPPEDPPAATPVVEKPTPAEQVYTFATGATFAVNVQVDVPLDLILEPGEQVRNLVGGAGVEGGPAEPAPPAPAPQPGATPASPWSVKEGGAGQGDTLRHHVFVIAAAPNLTMGVIITTTKRVYYLTCKSVNKSPIRVVRWQYPGEQGKPLKAKEPGLLPDPAQPKLYHVGYDLTSSQKQAPDWLPRQLVDDGKKTYIVYPEVTLFETVPVVRMIGPNGPQLVNARQYLNVLILDQLIGRAELRVGIGEHAEVVTITRGTLKTIRCPGDEGCPVWPQAAQILAKKGTPP